MKAINITTNNMPQLSDKTAIKMGRGKGAKDNYVADLYSLVL